MIDYGLVNKDIPTKTHSLKGYLYVYYPKHRYAYDNGMIPLHRLIWENANKANLLPWADVHHINRIRTDNDPKNLRGLMHYQHSNHHNPKDPEKAFEGRSKRKKKWWAKLREDPVRLAHVNELQMKRYWVLRDRKLEQMRRYRKQRKEREFVTK